MFLKGPSPPETFANFSDWKQDQVKTYLIKTVLPQAQANIVFVVIALAALFIFLLWRLFRRCCMCCCMRQSCEDRRNAAKPSEVLSGWGFWLQKGLLLLFAMAAFCMMLAGIIMAPRHLFVKVWGPVNRLTGHMNTTTSGIDDLIWGTMSDIYPILDDLRALVNNDVNLTAIKANLQSISTTLDTAAANPNTPTDALNALNNSMTSARTQIAALRPQLATSGLPTSLSTLQAGLPGLSTAVNTCQNYSARLANLDVPFAGLNTATGPPFSTASLEAAMAAVEVDSWRTSLGVMVAALDTWRSFRSNNTLGNLATAVSNLNATLAAVKPTQAPAASTALTAFADAWGGASAAMKTLLDRMAYVQANVASLDEASNAVLKQLQSVHGNITAFTSLEPSPARLASNLSALAGEVSLGSAAASLVTDLNNAQTAVNAVQAAVLDDARNALANLKTSLDNLSPKFSNTNNTLYTYKNAVNQQNFDALKSSGVASGMTWDLSKTAKTSADTAAGNSSVLAVQGPAGAGTLGTLATNIKSGAASVDSAAAATNASLASRPSLAPYTSLTASIKSVYDAMPTPKSRELSAVNSAIATVENLLVLVPSNVRSQTSDIKNSFGRSVDKIRDPLVLNPAEFQADSSDQVESVDLIRYRATCVLLAIAAALLVFLIVVVAINCPWGTGCAAVLLLMMAALLFLLGAVFAVVLVVAQDGCYNSEHVLLDALNPNSPATPMINYFFFGSTNTSVKDVLKSANVVDIERVENQVTGQADEMISSFTAQFTPQVKLSMILSSIRGFVNTTLSEIDALLVAVGVSAVRPLYVDLKSYPCCEVTGYSFKLWGVLTFGGWLILISCNMAMAFLGRLDQLPQSGCCGCKPLIGKRLHNAVQPEGKAGDQEEPVLAVAVAPQPQTMAGDAAAGAPPQVAYFYAPTPPAPVPGPEAHR